MIPYGCMDLVFYLGNPPQRLNPQQLFEPLECAMIAGQVTKPDFLQFESQLTIIGVGFYPHTMPIFCSVPAKEFTNEYLPATAIWGKVVAELQAQMAEAKNIYKAVELVQRFLLQHLVNFSFNSKTQYTTHLVAQILQHKGQIDLKRMANDMGISLRYIERLFQFYVGLRPTQFMRIVRFLNTIKAVNTNQFKHLTDLSYALGYADQSHFIRDFKAFTGMAPRQYFKNEDRLVDQFTQDSSSFLFNSLS